MADAPTGKRRRWWEDGKHSIEAEASGFDEAELDFRLDEELFQHHEVVVFRGELHLGDEATPACVYYPPAYGVGAHPKVTAPGLDLGRHQTPEGELCLDHPVLGKTKPMDGSEATLRAQHLWDLCENDPEKLHEEEADTPDPRANYYPYAPGSAVALIDLDVAGLDSGSFTLGALQLNPLKAAATEIRSDQPAVTTVRPSAGLATLTGPVEVHGAWLRIEEPPPTSSYPHQLLDWARNEHGKLLDSQLTFTRAFRQVSKQPHTPALVAFVYPDEGPSRDETHDAWLFLTIDGDDAPSIPRTFHLRSDEKWIRQPQLRPLEEMRVGIVGLGALGSPIAASLGRAGVGAFLLVDSDISTVGNRVRHELDLADLGNLKASSVQQRLERINPWCEVKARPIRLGSGHGSPQVAQRYDDIIVSGLGECDLVINATAHEVTGYYCSQIANEIGKPMLHTWVSTGAWGGRVLLQRPGRSGCTECLGHFQESPCDDIEIPSVTDDPEIQEVAERGCADLSFTGPGFELSSTATAATRFAVQALISGEDEYPKADFDLITLCFRDSLTAMPTATYTTLPVHPRCAICQKR